MYYDAFATRTRNNRWSSFIGQNIDTILSSTTSLVWHHLKLFMEENHQY